jgi:glycosyltransferase involved in cell wall biosynthesis
MPASRVSVLINNYNYGRYLGDAIDSALGQTHPCEVVVVDDGSTDGSRDVLEGYRGKVVSVLKENGGQASAFNAGFAAASGDVLCLLDADDVFRADKVARVAQALAEHPDAGWCFHQMEHVQHWPPSWPEAVESPSASAVDLRSQVAAGKSLPLAMPATSALSFRRHLLGALLPMPEQIRITADNYLKWAALGLGSGILIPESLAAQRLHGENAYTLSPDGRRRALGAAIAAQTSTVIRERHPHMSRFARGLLIDSLAYAHTAPASADLHAAVRGALARLPWTERLPTTLRGWVRYLRVYRGTGPAA